MSVVETPQFIGIDLGTSGARISIIEPIFENTIGDDDRNNNKFREVYSQAIMWDTDGNNNNNNSERNENDDQNNEDEFGCGPYDDADAWMKGVDALLTGASNQLDGGLKNVVRICVSGTSASCVLVNKYTLQVTRPPRMYNYDISSESSTSPAATTKIAAETAIKILDQYVPKKHTARARTGSLAKLIAWSCQNPFEDFEVLCHQSDYVSSKLMMYESHADSDGKSGERMVDANDDDSPVPQRSQQQPQTITSDWHNCLKLGYDVQKDCWPDWITACLEEAGIVDPLNEHNHVIPLRVVSPGQVIGTISPTNAKRYGLPTDTVIVGGTTDSNAAFFAAAGAQPQIGTAVTSLGSTLAIKLLSQQYVEDADRGVYSHRFPSFSSISKWKEQEDQGGIDHKDKPQWLVGGASNVGCAIFRALDFSNDELDSLSALIDPSMDSPLSYYPLVKTGERFPTADADKQPVLEPVPENRQDYLHGLLQSIAYVERDGFNALKDLGSPSPRVVWTCGGGSRNEVWSNMRERILRSTQNLKDENFDANEDVDVPEPPPLRVRKAENTEASYGAAVLAAANYRP